MILLSCETSTLLGSVCLSKDRKVLSRRELMRQGSHSESLNNLIQQMLDETSISLKQVDLFVSGVGPGSFTGIRISLNTIKSFSYFHGKPCKGVDSLLNLAYTNVMALNENDVIVPMINAYKNMVYTAAYKKKSNALEMIQPPQVVRVQNLNNFVSSKAFVVGDGFTQYENYFDPDLKARLQRPLQPQDHPLAETAAVLALDPSTGPIAWNELIPLYLRESEAEENAKGIKYEPLK